MGKKMDWFRLYPEIRRDPKMRRLNPEERWLWIAILCIASDSPDRGKLLISEELPYEAMDIADEAAMPIEVVESGLDKFKRLKMLDMDESGIFFIPKWEDRQYDNPSDAPSATRERKRKSRAKKNDSQASHDNVTNGHDTDTDTDTDKESDKDKNKVVVEEDDEKPFEKKPDSTEKTNPKFAQAYSAFEKQFYYAVNSKQTDELGRYIDLGMDPEVIENAISITRKNGKDLDYFWGILENCEQQGILTMLAFEQAKQEKKKRQHQASQRGQPVKKNDVPHYVQRQLDKRQEEASVPIDPKQQKEADRLLVQLEEMDPNTFRQKWGEGA